MTAISDALAKAGYDVVTRELAQHIDAAMKQAHDNIPRALKIFLRANISHQCWDEMARAYFVTHLPQPRDHLQRELQAIPVSPAEMPGDGHKLGEPQQASAVSGQPSSRPVRVKPHRRRRPKSLTSHFRSDIRVDAVFQTRKISGRALADLRWDELPGLVAKNAELVAQGLQRDTKLARDALLALYLQQSCIVQDPGTKVPEFVSPAQLEELDRLALEHAPRVLTLCGRYVIDNLKHPMGVIADAHA